MFTIRLFSQYPAMKQATEVPPKMGRLIGPEINPATPSNQINPTIQRESQRRFRTFLMFEGFFKRSSLSTGPVKYEPF